MTLLAQFTQGDGAVGQHYRVPLGPGVRIGVAILSYNGRLAFGVTGDYDTATDTSVIAEGIEAEIER